MNQPRANAEQMANRMKWLAELETTTKKQGASWLKRKNYAGEFEYCCLGIACEVVGVKETKQLDNTVDGVVSFAFFDKILPLEAVRLLGLANQNPTVQMTPIWRTCSFLNDSQKLNFKQIAEVLRPLLSNPEYLG